jgi:adenylate cyclase
VGVGLNTGDVVVGNIGSERRAKYGVVGRHVNLASRIEAQARPGQILAAEATLHDGGAGIVINGQMEIVAKGVSAAITVYDIGGLGV